MSTVLVLNAGSSSLKFSLQVGDDESVRGNIERINTSPRAVLQNGTTHTVPGTGHAAALDWLLGWLPSPPDAVGHRVVHGGDAFTAPVRVTAEVLTRLEALVPLAPLHQGHNLEPVRYFLARRPTLPQVVCFDTAFHATQDRLERLYALPRRYFDEGVKRYGFHGLSYEYVAGQVTESRVVVCHLGNGASLCALRDGRSQATTMGFTALDGLVMGTRCGAIDPGVLLYLLQHDRLTPDALSELLYTQSGLLGISGQSADMRDLLASDRPEAAEAVALFCYRIARELGALVAVLGGLDALVFTAGIGEHSPAVREQVCHRAAWLGIDLDSMANAAHGEVISSPTSKVIVRIVPTNEEQMIARHTVRVLGGG